MITNEKAQYDACAKRILAQKIILAHILVKCVKEFKNEKPKDVVGYIENDPMIEVPIDQDFTNSRIVGINNEDATINEGLIRFDLVFYVNVKSNKAKIIVNIEAQKAEPSRYQILNRAIFYGCRLISSQKDRDFKNSNYDDIKQVYSIWLCMNMDDNSLSHYHFVKDEMLVPHDWKGNVNLLNIILIGITNDIPNLSDEYNMHRLLGTLFSNKLNTSEKLSIIKQEYDISVDDELREDVNVMCNLGEGIEEIAVERTTKKVTKEVTEGFIMSMYNIGYTLAQISEVTKLSIEDIKTIVNKKSFN